MTIHEFAAKGDLLRVRDELRNGVAVDARDERDDTPLACAARSASADKEMLKLLIESGADVNAAVDQGKHFPIELAACSASLGKVQCLLDAGADINAVAPKGYTALINIMYALHNHDALVPMANFLVKHGAVIDCQTDYGESPLSVASGMGRFDVVKHLLDAGADSSSLQWTPLMRAIAVGSCAEVTQCLEATDALDGRDRFSRTPLHLAAVVGDISKADLLRGRGANLDERARGEDTPLMICVASGNCKMARWFIDHGADIEAVDESGNTPLIAAAQAGKTDCVRLLLEAGAERNHRNEYHQTAKSLATNEPIVRLLTRPGEDLSDISKEMKRTLIGLPFNGSIHASREEYLAGRDRRFGRSDPEVMPISFWHEMVRGAVNAYQARRQFGDTDRLSRPVWCFDRYGMSFTELPAGRFAQIGGEHEDYYDPDFCIYNEVVIHDRSGTFEILGYPEAVFPSTDFHSATLVEGDVYIIGRLGYQGSREFGTTPVYRLNCRTWKIEAVQTTGDNPGWIYEHSACFDGVRSLIISDGKIARHVDGEEQHVENNEQFRLDLREMRWNRL
jgi:ankyrin repeat protein